ncbi:MAG: hypothetical protein ACXWWR_01060 [Candidatus Limnocylindrales bacterium]
MAPVAGELDGPGEPPAVADGAADDPGDAGLAGDAAGEPAGVVDADVAGAPDGLGSPPGSTVKPGVVPQAATMAARTISQAIRRSAGDLDERGGGTAPE